MWIVHALAAFVVCSMLLSIPLRRIDGEWYTEEQLQDPAVLKTLGFNQREIDFIVR